jgi:uncharacterized protein YqgC (DUF456 family)
MTPIDWWKFGTEWLTLTALLVGLFGLLIPIFPGLLVMWLAALAYGIFSSGFDLLGWIMFILITLLALFGSVVDNIVMGAKARQGGASWVSILLGFVAGIAGTAAFPPIGGFLLAPLALFLAEYLRQKDWKLAFETVKALLVGWGWAVVLRFIIGVVIVALWMIWAWV